MTEPDRWLQSPAMPDELRALLQTARAPEPPPLSPAVHARVGARVAGLGAAPAGVGALLARLATLKGLAVLTTVALVGGAGAWLATPATRPTHHAVAHAPAATPTDRVANAAPAVPAAPPLAAPPSPVASSASSDSAAPAAITPPPASATHHAAPRSAHVASAAAGAPSALERERESALVERARRNVDRRDARAALAELAAHDREFPRGQFAQDCDYLRVRALLLQGRRAEARRRADALLAAQPRGIYAARLRALFGGAP